MDHLIKHPDKPFVLMMREPRAGSDPPLTDAEEMILALHLRSERYREALAKIAESHDYNVMWQTASEALNP